MISSTLETKTHPGVIWTQELPDPTQPLNCLKIKLYCSSVQFLLFTGSIFFIFLNPYSFYQASFHFALKEKVACLILKTSSLTWLILTTMFPFFSRLLDYINGLSSCLLVWLVPSWSHHRNFFFLNYNNDNYNNNNFSHTVPLSLSLLYSTVLTEYIIPDPVTLLP